MNRTEGDIVKALQKHHEGSEWAFLAQVRNQTGYDRNVRTADAIAFSLWPSRGIYATGYEVKVSKQDLKKELAQPEKAEEIARFCKCWFVATPEGLCKPEDLPLTWGLVEVKDTGKLKWTKPATPNEHVMEPTWRFVCAIMRNVADASIPKSAFNALLEEEKERLKKRSKENQSWELKQAREGLAKLRKAVEDFEKESGVKIDRYSEHFAREIGQAVNVVRHMYGSTPFDRIVQLKDIALKIAQDIEALTTVYHETRPDAQS